MIKTQLTDAGSGKQVSIKEGLTGDKTLVTEPYKGLKGTFRAVSRASAGTSDIVEPLPEGSIMLTDLLISAEKKAAGEVGLRFTDGTNTISIMSGIVAEAPINLSISFGGKWHGWKDAKLQLVTVQNFGCSIACGYVKIPSNQTMTYDAWDAER